jgi:hypothetical protein
MWWQILLLMAGGFYAGYFFRGITLSSRTRREARELKILQLKRKQAQVQSEIDEIHLWRARERPCYDFEDDGE